MVTNDDKHAATKRLLKRAFTKPTVDEVDWENASDPKRYNCFGFAIGILKWWQPYNRDRNGTILNPHDCWSRELPSNNSVDAFVKAAELHGFQICEKGWEPEFEKIVLFFAADATERSFTHAARQVSPSRWKSKLGKESDIEHDEGISCTHYGDGRIYMKRQRI